MSELDLAGSRGGLGNVKQSNKNNKLDCGTNNWAMTSIWYRMEEREYWSEANQETGVLQGEEMIQEEKEN